MKIVIYVPKKITEDKICKFRIIKIASYKIPDSDSVEVNLNFYEFYKFKENRLSLNTFFKRRDCRLFCKRK